MFTINWSTEIFGIAGSILVLVSMLYKTNTYRGAFLLRLINGIGSIVYIIYGLLLPAPSTVVLNIFAACINIYYLCRIKKDYNVQSRREDK